MNEVRFKAGGKAAREIVAAIATSGAPWWVKPQLADLLEHLDELGVVINIKKAARKRTDNQNNFYWLGVGIFAKAVGMTPDEAHEAVLCEYHGSTEVQIGSRTFHVPKGRSKDLQVEAMGELRDFVSRRRVLQCDATRSAVSPMKNLRKAARGRDCQLRIPGVCNHNPDTTILAHVRRGGVGGMGFKPPDLCAVLACSDCHDMIDGRRLRNDEDFQMLDTWILEAMCRTICLWAKEGLV